MSLKTYKQMKNRQVWSLLPPLTDLVELLSGVRDVKKLCGLCERWY